MVVSLVAVLALVALVLLGVEAVDLRYFWGVVVPYLAFIVFLAGLSAKILRWAKSPVPFRIPTTCGQQKSLPWIKPAKLENPSSTWGVIGRMALEILLFRSLFRNTKMELRDQHGPKLDYASAKWLWLAALVFHWSFLVTLLRHLRFFSEPTLKWVQLLESLDSFAEVGAPLLMLSGAALLAAVSYLFVRRVIIPEVRYISLPADYFPLYLIMAIAVTGILMRYFLKTDVTGIKVLTMSLVQFKPVIPEGVGAIFYVHLFLVCCLFAYFPFSKLMHLGGVFLSPTRNLANNNRAVRHVNPWNYPVKFHTYQAYEDDFRKKMVEAGLPVEKPLEEGDEPEAKEE
jgi:nitrate reductase gamma subunit